LQPAAKKRPLYEGQVHFMRRVLPDNTISVLNVSWSVPVTTSDQGVWATLFIRMSGAQLVIYDAAPDAPVRKRLAAHPFKLSEPVLPHPLRPPRPGYICLCFCHPIGGSNFRSSPWRNDVLTVYLVVNVPFFGMMS
jgi:hypothetical protein